MVSIRLYIDPDSVSDFSPQALIELHSEQAHYVSRVMRLKVGNRLTVFNGRDGEWQAEITCIGKKSATVKLVQQLRPPLAGPNVWLCCAPLKFGRIDYLAQKITELGAARLQPVLTDYSQSDKVNDKRLRANMIEAAEQCERVSLPELLPPQRLPQLLSEWPRHRPLLFADEGGEGKPAADYFTGKAAPELGWGMLIGPEGGFSPKERSLLYEQPFVIGLSLGPRILRADTAALTLLAVSMAHWGDWHIKPHYASEN